VNRKCCAGGRFWTQSSNWVGCAEDGINGRNEEGKRSRPDVIVAEHNLYISVFNSNCEN
jgi:hypothetical protein